MIRLEIVRTWMSKDERTGNYDIYLYLPDQGGPIPKSSHRLTHGYVEHHAHIKGFNRNLGWAELVRDAVTALEIEEMGAIISE